MERQEEIDARLARFTVSRDARDLWPAVPVASFRAAQEEVARVATAVLTGAPPPVALRRSPGMDAQALNAAAFAGGMGPLIGFWCETGSVTADQEVAERFAMALAHGRRRAAHLRHALQEILVQLADRDVQAGVLRSTHVRECYLPDPGTGSTSHIDLVIRRDHWQAASAVMRGLGLVDAGPTTRSDRNDWTHPGPRIARSLEFAHMDDSWFVSLCQSPVGRPGARGDSLEIGTPATTIDEVWREFARPVRVLPPPLLLADLAVQASNHFYELSLLRLVELVFVARRDFAGRPEVWSAFDDLVARSAVGSLVFPALHLVERLVPGTIDPSIREHVATSAPWRLRRVVKAASPASVLRVHPLPPVGRSVWAAPASEVAASIGTEWVRHIRSAITRWGARVRWR